MRFLIILLATLLTPCIMLSQVRPPQPVGNDSPVATAPPKPGPKAFRDLITDKALADEGLFSVYKLEEKFYWEIPDSLLGRQIMAVTRISKTATGVVWGGFEVNRQVLQWEKINVNKLLLRCVGFVNMSSDSTQNIFESVQISNVHPIIGSFDIKAVKKDTSSVIDVSDFIKADNQALSLTPLQKQYIRIGSQSSDRSYIQSIKSYPINTEIKVVRTFIALPPSMGPSAPGSPNPLPGGVNAGVVSMEFNTSLVLLPKIPMRKRIEDRRVGYMSSSYNVYSDKSQRMLTDIFVERWRLEPKNAADLEKAKRGELIEPAKPIVYYIDPATPEQWKKYLKQGVEDWLPAFEKAGWKNAIQVKDWPVNDSTMSLDDSRFSVIRYLASSVENAQGPRISDPRSGEIIESHIYWYHNVMNIFKHLYAIQVGHLDARAQKPEWDEELLGVLIRYVAAHEVGHTIGLLHNWISSHTVPVEKLRDKEYIRKYGHSPSIMEYARFNYVAQPGDGIALQDLVPRVNTYDEWAIEWGYKLIFDTKDETEDIAILDKWIKNHEGDSRYSYGTEQHPYDPRINNEDLGDNQMKANEYGITNLKRILPLQIEWTKQEGKSYDYLHERYGWIVAQLNWYYSHVVKYIGGVYDTYKKTDQAGSVYQPTPKALQKEALDFLKRNLFETQTWLLNKDIISRIRPNYGVDAIREQQESFLNSILSVSRLQRMIESSAIDKTTYGADELLVDLRKIIRAELDSKKSVDIFRRNLQKLFAERLIWLAGQNTVLGTPATRAWGIQSFGGINPAKSDISSLVKAELRALQSKIKLSLPATSDKMTRYHLQDIIERIDAAFKTK